MIAILLADPLAEDWFLIFLWVGVQKLSIAYLQLYKKVIVTNVTRWLFWVWSWHNLLTLKSSCALPHEAIAIFVISKSPETMEPFKLAKFCVLVLLTWESSARKVTEQSDKKHLVTMVHPKPHQAGKDSSSSARTLLWHHANSKACVTAKRQVSLPWCRILFYGIPVNLIKRLKSPRNPTFKMGNRHLKPLLCPDSSVYCNWKQWVGWLKINIVTSQT